ncbi:MAG: outer membrane beta-barrel protein [Candidatus Mariimomonas ferrooxydans]
MNIKEIPITFLTVIIFIVSSTVIAFGVEFKIEPSLTLGEEYNDNIFLQKDNEVDDYITRVRPSFTLHYKAPMWEWDVDYIFDYRYYSKGAREADTTHDLDVIGRIEIIKEFSSSILLMNTQGYHLI